MVKLRDFQIDCFNAILKEIKKQNRNILIQAPTGSGKTVIFTQVVKHLNLKSLILVNKNTLINQTVKHLGEDTCVYHASSNRKEFGHFTVGSIQSIRNAKDVPFFDIVIIDEAHSFNMKTVSSCINYKTLIGFTASPFDGRGRFIFGEDQFFKELTFKKTFSEITKLGWLCPIVLKDGGDSSFDTEGVSLASNGDFNLKQLNTKILTQQDRLEAQVFDAVERSKKRNKIAFICCSIEHAKRVYDLLPDGERTITHSKMSSIDTDINIKRFEDGSARYLVSVMQISTGYDYPPLDCVVLMRPTRSPVLYCQAVGRVARLHKSKTTGLLLDYGNVVKNLGSIYNVNLDKKKKVEDTLKICPMCDAFNFVKHLTCVDCAYEFKKICPTCGELIKVGESCADCKKKKITRELSSNLSLYAYENVEWTSISNWSTHWHISKKGNRCVKITYYSGFSRLVDEYFNEPTNSFFKIKMKNFLGMHCKHFDECSNLEEFKQLVDTKGKPPVKVIVKKIDGYKKITSRKHYD